MWLLLTMKYFRCFVNILFYSPQHSMPSEMMHETHRSVAIESHFIYCSNIHNQSVMQHIYHIFITIFATYFYFYDLIIVGQYEFVYRTEQPSSSSLSTTTSSVTSMTSLEHESNDTTSVSASDYGNDMASDYGNDGWDVAGDMDVSLFQQIHSLNRTYFECINIFANFPFYSDIAGSK